MVLSNKKLKQKLRASLAESIASSLSASGPNHDDAVETAPQPPQSLKQLLDSSTQKPRLTKREKRRKLRSLTGAGEDDLKGDVGVEGNGERNELDGSAGDWKKDKKRKRDGEIGGSGGEVKESAKKKKKKKNKKAKKKTKKKADEGVKEEEKKEKSEAKDEVDGKVSAQNAGVVDVKEEEKKEKSEAKDEVDGKVSAQNAGVVDDSQDNVDNARKVYVGGIPYYSTEDDIRSYFESCGTITEIDCMTFPESGKFRGIAIISFKTDAAAKRALALDGADMGGLFLKIQPYKGTRPSKTSAPKTSNFAPPVMEGYNRIYIGNLSWDITEEDLRNFLSGCNISSLRFGMDKETGEFRGYAHVDFADGDSMKKAIRLNQKVLYGRPVKITSAIPKKNVKAQPEAVDTHTDNTELDNNKDDNPDDNVQVDSKTKNPSEVVEVNNDSTPAVISTGKMRRRTCYLCGEKGHISSACPKSPPDIPST